MERKEIKKRIFRVEGRKIKKGKERKELEFKKDRKKWIRKRYECLDKEEFVTKTKRKEKKNGKAGEENERKRRIHIHIFA